MPLTEGDGAKPEEWIVVCVGCLCIKRNGKWTNERTAEVEGKSSGFCDRCAKARRKELGLR